MSDIIPFTGNINEEEVGKFVYKLFGFTENSSIGNSISITMTNLSKYFNIKNTSKYSINVVRSSLPTTFSDIENLYITFEEFISIFGDDKYINIFLSEFQLTFNELSLSLSEDIYVEHKLVKFIISMMTIMTRIIITIIFTILENPGSLDNKINDLRDNLVRKDDYKSINRINKAMYEIRMITGIIKEIQLGVNIQKQMNLSKEKYEDISPLI